MKPRWLRFGLRSLLLLVAQFCILATCLRAWLDMRRAEARKELKRLENFVLLLETEVPRIPGNAGKAVYINAEITKTTATIGELKKQFPRLHLCKCGETAEERKVNAMNSVVYCLRCGARNQIFPAGPDDSSK